MKVSQEIQVVGIKVSKAVFQEKYLSKRDVSSKLSRADRIISSSCPIELSVVCNVDNLHFFLSDASA